MPINTKRSQNQRALRSRGGAGAKQGGITATQFMSLTALFASLCIVLNVYHLMPAAGMDEPLPTGRTHLMRDQPPLRATSSEASSSSNSNTNEQAQQASSSLSTSNSNLQEGKPPNYHIIFSSGCGPKQSFQSYIFFYHAMKSGQPGQVTRIASCNDAQEEEHVKNFHQQYIQHMSPNFHFHITPDYSGINKEKPEDQGFHYFNKPFSTHHWMEHALGYIPQQTKVGDNIHDDTILILCDPDQIIMRPFTNNYFSNETEIWNKRTTHPILNSVTHGKPMGALYGFGDQWLTKTNITRYVPHDELPSVVQSMSTAEIRENYAVGPPYIATAHDFWKIATTWKDFVPKIQKFDYPHLLAEMFAYCLAAAHLKLPHQIAKSFMISDVGSFELEGWKMMDKYSKVDMCIPGKIDQDHLPHILHYCQRYLLGKYVIGKHRIPSAFLSCEEKLLRVPPPDLGEKFNFAIEPDLKVDKKMVVAPPTVRHHAFMLCHLIPYLNEAAIYFKDHHCEGKTINKEESLVFYDSMEIDPSFF